MVSKDVAPYEIVGGVPARHLRWRFAPVHTETLQQLAWWDWDHATLKAALPDIRVMDIDAFIEKYR